VIVVADAEPDTFDLVPEEKAELLERIREARIGPWIDAEVLAFWHASRGVRPGL
jgi:hypothetical protein